MTSFVKNTIVITAGLSRSLSGLRHPPTQVTSTATFLFECLKLSQTELNPDVEFVKCLTQPAAALQPGWKEMERNSLSPFPHSLFISPLSLHFLYQNLSHFVAKC